MSRCVTCGTTSDQRELLHTLRALLSEPVVLRAAEELGWRPERVRALLDEAAWAWEEEQTEGEL